MARQKVDRSIRVFGDDETVSESGALGVELAAAVAKYRGGMAPSLVLLDRVVSHLVFGQFEDESC